MPDFSVITQNLPYLLWGRALEGQPGGLLLTLIMSLEAGVLALVVGVLLALAAWLSGGWTRRILFAWADFIRGIPLIFVIFWLYFLLPSLFGVNLPDTITVVLAIAWFTSAAVMYSTLAGLEALPKGQVEAGLSAGFSRTKVLVNILLPQALPNVLPSLVGVFISLIKDTSLAFIVNVPELTTVAGQVNNRTQIYPTEIFLFTGAVYFLLCGALSLTVHLAGGRRARPA
ncbi:amino acid ABC transporter permease [Aquabacter cavernae]|uniref:amino acid ABC transporter permease n=1 Tax=Aquabacter cavernae TaxID=2496029 RepID=UPI000F8C5672|nr:amino acid ABC transporter permease [Aquabacter cavernae]